MTTFGIACDYSHRCLRIGRLRVTVQIHDHERPYIVLAELVPRMAVCEEHIALLRPEHFLNDATKQWLASILPVLPELGDMEVVGKEFVH